MCQAGRSPLHVVVGIAAAASIAALTAFVLPQGELECPAVVDASQTFTLESIAPGRYQWTLRDGRPPGSQRLVRQRVLQYERSDLVEMRLEPELVAGVRVTPGQKVASVRSLHNDRQLDELHAQRAALAARRALLVAGGPPAEVEVALREVQVAQAEHATGQADLGRTRRLAEQGLVSAADLEVAELRDEVQRLQVDLARNSVEVARRQAQPQALDELDARLKALDAGIAELERLLEEEQVLCPIAGLAEVGAGGFELRVHQLTPVYLDIAMPARSRSRAHVGAAVLFSTDAAPGVQLRGVLVEVAPSAAMVRGRSVFWASARLENPDLCLRRGMTGTARIALPGEGFDGLLASIKSRLWRLWS